MTVHASGIEPGQRRLNGPQTTGRTYRNLSQPEFEMRHDINLSVPMRDGIRLMADVHRPEAEGKHPALIAFSAYPRQIQNTGAPMGFVEAGASDFFVPRGYAHVIANARGTNGSGGEYSFFDATERHDVHDVVEWVAEQPWCDGNVGMIGISYFAMAQLEAAVEQPPHLRAIFPLATSPSPREIAFHGGLFNFGFISAFFRAVGVFGAMSDEFLRGWFATAITKIMHVPWVHKKWAHYNGESALATLGKVVKAHHPPHPWDDYLQEVLLDHPYPDEYWDERDVTAMLQQLRIPIYLGCDWDNLTVHLPSTFRVMDALPEDIPLRVAFMGSFGLAWPWESMHIEALAWFDHWLRGRDTGIMEGSPVRYVLPGADEQWHASPTWPPAGRPVAYALCADGALAQDEGTPGERKYACLPADAEGVQTKTVPVVQHLDWQTPPLPEDIDIAGEIVLELDATLTAGDTAFFVTLQDIAEDGAVHTVSAGWRRAAVDDEERFRPVTPGVQARYRIALVDNARRFRAGHRIGLLLRGDDRIAGEPVLAMHHLSVGIPARIAVASSSRLILPQVSL